MIIRNDNITEASLGVSITDADAQAYITRVMSYEAISSEKATYINDFFVALKSNNLWNKIRLMYPMIGTVTQTHFLEASGIIKKNGAFLDLAYTSGVSTSSSNAQGLMGPSGNYPFRIYQTPDEIWSNGINDIHACYYGQTNTTGNYAFSTYTGGNSAGVVLTNFDNVIGGRIGEHTIQVAGNSYGVQFLQRKSTTSTSYWQDGVKKAEDTDEQGGTSWNDEIRLLYTDNNGHRSSFFSFGFAMTDQQIVLYSSLISDLQSKLNRLQD